MLIVIQRSFLICLSLLVFSACSTTTSETDLEESRLTSERRATARLTPGWLDPMTLQIHGNTDKPETGDLVLRGRLDGWVFLPEGEIAGDLRTAPQSSTVKVCRLLLSNRSLYFEGDSLPGGVIYLDGSYDTETKLFYPSGRQFLTAND